MTKINWFDLDGSLWSIDAKWWIIDKNNPDKYIIKISQEEGSLILSGLYKNDNNEIYYNGLEGWLSNSIYDRIKNVKKIELSDIGFSFREFSNEDFLNQQVDNINFLLHNIDHIKNDEETISILTARGNKSLHTSLLSKLQNVLAQNDLNIKIDKVYFVNDSDLSRHIAQPAMKKTLVILEHMIGFRIENSKFVEVEQEKYNISTFFDDESHNIETALSIQSIYKNTLANTKDSLKKEIIEYVEKTKPVLKTYLITNNKVNPFIEKELTLINP